MPQTQPNPSSENGQPQGTVPTSPNSGVPGEAESVARFEGGGHSAEKSSSPNTEQPHAAGPSSSQHSSSGGYKVMMWFVGSVAFLFFAFYVLLLLGLSSGNLSNPLFESLGIEAEGLKKSVLSVTNFSFGFLSLICLLTSLVRIFQWFNAPSDAYDRPRYLRKSAWALGFLILTVGLWMGLFLYISGANVRPTGNTPNSLIVTEPQNTIGLAAPVTIKFNIGDKLKNRIDSALIRQINWYLDNDDTVDGSGPEVVYEFTGKGSDNGRYNARAEVLYYSPEEGEEKTYTDTKQVIIANEKVVAVIDASPLVGEAPLAVKFSAENSYDPDGQIIQYEWDLDGDTVFEITDNRTNLEKVFDTVGEHIVRLRVTGTNQDFTVTEATIIVQAPDEAVRAQIVSPDNRFSGTAPFTVTLDGSQSFVREGQIVKYEWQIEGESESIINRKIQRTFDQPGTYAITLVVEDTDGRKDFAEQVITVDELVNVAINTKPALDPETQEIRGKVPFEVIFDSTSSSVPRSVEWQWDFEADGITDAFGQTVSHVYRSAGVYTAQLTIIDADGVSHQKTVRVRVAEPELSAVITANPQTGEAPLVVEFDGSPSQAGDENIIDYIWQFAGTDPIHGSAQITREFKTTGTHEVILTVVTETGKRASTKTLVSARKVAPKAVFTFFAPSAENPRKIQFDGSGSTGSELKYEWTFGDGTVSYQRRPVKVYPSAGSYTVSLRITDKDQVVAVREEVVVVE